MLIHYNKIIILSSSIIHLFSLNPGSGVPIFRQLIDQIKQAIRMSLLVKGEQLPSVRVLASELQVNPMTISKAFSQLEVEGVLIRKRGVGMLVAEQQQNNNISQLLDKPLVQFIANAREENLSNDEIMTLVQQYLSIQSQEK